MSNTNERVKVRAYYLWENTGNHDHIANYYEAMYFEKFMKMFNFHPICEGCRYLNINQSCNNCPDQKERSRPNSGYSTQEEDEQNSTEYTQLNPPTCDTQSQTEDDSHTEEPT